MKNSAEQDVELPQNDFGNALGAGHLENQYSIICCICQPSRWASSRPISAGRRSSVWIGGSEFDNWLKLKNSSTLHEKTGYLQKWNFFEKNQIFLTCFHLGTPLVEILVAFCDPSSMVLTRNAPVSRSLPSITRTSTLKYRFWQRISSLN